MESSKIPARVVAIAALRAAETLGDMLLLGALTDAARIREALIQRTEAETASAKADAGRKLAEAADASNRATFHLRTDAEARLEMELKEAAVEKVRAETRAIDKDAETRRVKEIAEAKAKLIGAVAQLRSQGGDLLLSRENIERILEAEPPSPALLSKEETAPFSIGADPIDSKEFEQIVNIPTDFPQK